MKWILLLIVLCTGCMKTQSVKIVTDIPPNGEPSFHTEYKATF